MTVHFTSDLHLGHRKVADLRGFDSTDAHDAAIATAWADRVRPDDVVWVLGDLAVGRPLHALDVLASLPGRKRLVLGNHDYAHPGIYRDAWKWHALYARVFDLVAPFARARVMGREVALSHFPYHRDRGEVRHVQWRLPDQGLPLLHGHTHGTERLTVTPWFDPEDSATVEVHVGLDAWDLAPVDDATVAALLADAG